MQRSIDASPVPGPCLQDEQSCIWPNTLARLARPQSYLGKYSAADHNAVDRCWRPGFSLKCGYFLTDTHEAGMANTWIVPGRHMDAALETPEGNVGQPKDACGALLQANIACPLLLILS